MENMNKAAQHRTGEEIHTKFVKCIRHGDDVVAVQAAAVSILAHCLKHYTSTEDQVAEVANLVGFLTETLFFDYEKAKEIAELIKAELENRILATAAVKN